MRARRSKPSTNSPMMRKTRHVSPMRVSFHRARSAGDISLSASKGVGTGVWGIGVRKEKAEDTDPGPCA